MCVCDVVLYVCEVIQCVCVCDTDRGSQGEEAEQQRWTQMVRGRQTWLLHLQIQYSHSNSMEKLYTEK